MGSYIAAPFSEISPAAPLVRYTQGTTAEQALAALYGSGGFVASATLVTDGGVPLTLGPSGFSKTIPIPLGPNAVTFTVTGMDGSEAAQIWKVAVVQDKTATTISGIVQGQKIAFGSPVPVRIPDLQSGVSKDSLGVLPNNKDVTASISMTASGFAIPASMLGKGAYSIRISVCDTVGNTSTARYDAKVK